MTKQRRVIWLSDEEWAAVSALAKAEHLTISALVRGRLVEGTKLEREVAADRPWERGHKAPDASFQAWRPVPKPGKGK